MFSGEYDCIPMSVWFSTRWSPTTGSGSSAAESAVSKHPHHVGTGNGWKTSSLVVTHIRVCGKSVMTSLQQLWWRVSLYAHLYIHKPVDDEFVHNRLSRHMADRWRLRPVHREPRALANMHLRSSLSCYGRTHTVGFGAVERLHW